MKACLTVSGQVYLGAEKVMWSHYRRIRGDPGDHHAQVPVAPSLGRSLSELSSTATDVNIFRSGINYRFRSLQVINNRLRLIAAVSDNSAHNNKLIFVSIGCESSQFWTNVL